MLEQTQPYSVIHRRDDIEYRLYPAATFAQVRVSGPYTMRLNSGFRELSHYVTGGNTQQRAMPLVAPVCMQACTLDEAHVRMYLGADPLIQDIPAPLSDAVEITTATPVYVAALMLSDLFSQTTITSAATRLRRALDVAHIAYHTTPEYRYYTSPWQQLGRRGDVVYRLTQPPHLFM